MDSRPNSDLIRSITQSEIASFVSDGVVHLPGILDIDWIYFLRTALEEVIDDPNGLDDVLVQADDLHILLDQPIKVEVIDGVKIRL